jgi:hypothetical protein
VTSGPLTPVARVTSVPTDADAVARMKLDGARAALTVRDYDGAGKAILEVIRMAGVPEPRRAQAFIVACDLGVRTKDWELAKTMCEKALSIKGVLDDDRVWSTATLKALRKQFPELFK